MRKYLFTSESVTEGHPDKVCDCISDSILDAILAQDPNAHVACETTATTGLITVMGEITTDCYVDIAKTARNTVREIGYVGSNIGFDADTCGVITSIDEQSPDISMGVNRNIDATEDELNSIGAGDQGMMFGYACDETPVYMPAPIYYAHKAAKRLTDVRKSGILPYLKPDGKTQFTFEYNDFDPVRVDTILISSQHSESVKMSDLEHDIIEYVAKAVLPDELLSNDIKYLVNPTGRFVRGGPCADSGLTGRKIIVDTYGGAARHGGGCFSGKDPTKVDRSAAYAARHIAKNLVAAGVAKRCELEIAYAIGRPHPVSIMVETFGTENVDPLKIEACVKELFDLRPKAIIKNLELKQPIYRQVAAYGHFGRDDLDLPWERLNRVSDIKSYLGL
ncbi:MAG: methionine adenosyltransferase [Clostridiales bacterium]|nr:methionine adenosyltransferase [Clostridiales bacterium]